MPKKYSIEDVIASKEPQEFSISWKDGEIDIRITPITYGQWNLLQKQYGSSGLGDNSKVTEQIFIECVERPVYNEDGEIEEWKSFDKGELKKLVPGLVANIMDKVNEVLGMSTSVEDLKKYLGTMNEQKE